MVLTVVMLLPLGAAAEESGDGARLAVVGGRIRTEEGRLQARTIHIEGSRIVAVDDRKPLPGETVVDVEGASVVPAFIDCHVHLEHVEPEVLEQSGVGAVIDLGASGSLPHGRLAVFGAGPILTAPGGFPVRADWAGPGYAWELTGPEEARAAVAELAAADSLLIKVSLASDEGPVLDEATLRALVSEAHARGLKVAAHAMGDDDVRMATKVGMDLLAHAPTGRLEAGTIEQFCRRDGVAVIPTLVAFLQDPDARANLRQMVRQGCTVLYGTDPGNRAAALLGRPRQIGVEVAELRLMVEAGMTPAQVIASATEVPARYFDLEGLGSIAPGQVASLVAVRGDPYDDVGALAYRTLVIVGGEVLVP